jgi:putative FmdB family regulatory protein
VYLSRPRPGHARRRDRWIAAGAEVIVKSLLPLRSGCTTAAGTRHLIIATFKGRPVPLRRTGSAVTSGRFLNLSAMPLFEFACRDCGHRFETLVTGDRAAACPECRSADLDKLVSTFGARASGSGGRATSATRSPFT